MREYSTPLRAAVPQRGNLTDDVVRNGTDHPDAVVLSRRQSRGEGWAGVTAEQFLEEVRGVAAGFLAAGLGPGDRVALVCRTRYEWTLVDYALWFAGLVSVPVYVTAGDEQLAWILGDSAVSAAVVENRELAERVQAQWPGASKPEHLWVIDEGAVEALTGSGATVAPAQLEERRSAAGPGDPATIVYTSGTTGRPRGCVLTHGNFLSELTVTVDDLRPLFEEEDGATLLFLPMAHIFARVVQVGAIRSRTRLGHCADVQAIVEELETFGATFLLGVPRVFEKVFNAASMRAIADGRGRPFRRGVEVAIAWSRGRDTGRTSWSLRARHRALERQVFRPMRELFGERCRHLVCGGAPLGERLGHFYRGIGLNVLEGYGLTETTAAVAVNTPDAQKIGTVGRPLQGTAVRIAEDGELLVRGAQVFPGYWHDESATAEALGADGWLHTGDMGEIDNEGFVRITGRKQELLVTAGGKHVSPDVLEERVRSHWLVDQCLVVGDGQPFVAALITLDAEAFGRWKAEHGTRGGVADHVNDPRLREEVQQAVDAANAAVSKAEAIRRFTILPVSWDEDSGHLTPSLKLRRAAVLRDHADEAAALYQR